MANRPIIVRAIADKSQIHRLIIIITYYCLCIRLLFCFVLGIYCYYYYDSDHVIVSSNSRLIYFGKIESVLNSDITCMIPVRRLPEHKMKSMIIS